MKPHFYIRWTIWMILGATLIYGVAMADPEKSKVALWAIVLSLSPLLGFMIALGSPKASLPFNEWISNQKFSPYYLTGGLALLFAIPGLLTGTFNPYHTAIFALIVLVVFSQSKHQKENEFKFKWSDLALWLILWIPFDLRWYTDLQPHLDYTWWSVSISVIALIGWYGYRKADIGYNLVPKLKDLGIAFLALIAIMVLVVPPGLLTGFLSFSIPESYDFPVLAAHFIGLFLTVALPEELFFRGILLKGLEKVFAKKWIPMVISSLAFGLMHWNNADTLTAQIIYVSLASIAGVGYGWAYQKSGNNLFAAILVHTLVDWIWRLLFAG
jgi:membrane protease YdiL (CAAX protease family)